MDLLLCALCCETYALGRGLAPCDGGIRKVQTMVTGEVSRKASAQPGPQRVGLQPAVSGKCPPKAVRTGPSENTGYGWAWRVPTSCPQGRPPKPQLARECPGNALPSSLDRGGADSDGYSTVSEAPSGRHHRGRRQNEKCLAPAWLDMPIFKSADPNVDVTHTLWRFDVQGWLDQYQEENMMPTFMPVCRNT